MLPLNKDLNIKLLDDMDDKDLSAVCQVNVAAMKLCNDDNFWKHRTVKRYGTDALKGNTSNDNYKEYYQSGKAKNYILCKSIPHKSQLVVEDFYDPDNGIYSSVFTRDHTGLRFLLFLLADIEHWKYPLSLEYMKILKDKLDEYWNDIPVHRRKTFDRYSFSDKNKHMFTSLINITPTPPTLLRELARANPNFIKKISPDPIDKIRFIDHIHAGFRIGAIPLDIKWNQLCSNNYILSYSK